MNVIYLTFLFLFACGVRNVHSPDPDSGNPNLPRSPSGNLSSQSPSGSTSNPYDRTQVRCGASDAQSACQNECLALTAESSTIYNAYPGYKTTKYLYDNCGMVTDGKCSTATDSPICWCHTPKAYEDQRRMTLFNCRSGIEIVRKFINASTTTASDNVAKSGKKRISGQEMGQEEAVEAVAMYQVPPLRVPTRPRSPRPRPITRPGTRPGTNLGTAGFGNLPVGSSADRSIPRPSSSQKQEEEDFNSRPDGQPEGDLLWTDVRVLGNVVRAKLDTGSSHNIIHRKFTDHIVPVDAAGAIFSANNQEIQVVGTTTINLEIRRGIIIPLTGFVTDRHYQILLGADFFADYDAKIKISERKMEIRTRQTKVTMTIKFRDAPTGVDMISNRFPTYISLQIPARVNGRITKMEIDTGSNITVVNKNLVNQQTLHPVALKCSYAGGSPMDFMGKTNINLIIGSHSFNLPAFVPDFIPRFDFLTGNDFNKLFVELIDYKSKSVTLRFPHSSGYFFIKVPALVIKGQQDRKRR